MSQSPVSLSWAWWGRKSQCTSQTAVPEGGFSKAEFESPALWPAVAAQISGWLLIGLLIPEDETSHLGPCRQVGDALASPVPVA